MFSAVVIVMWVLVTVTSDLFFLFFFTRLAKQTSRRRLFISHHKWLFASYSKSATRDTKLTALMHTATQLLWFNPSLHKPTDHKEKNKIQPPFLKFFKKKGRHVFWIKRHFLFFLVVLKSGPHLSISLFPVICQHVFDECELLHYGTVWCFQLCLTVCSLMAQLMDDVSGSVLC